MEVNSSIFGLQMLAGMISGLIWFVVIFAIISYVYFSYTLMKIAQRLNQENVWLAWIPIANVYLLLKTADINPLWMLTLILTLIPFLSWLGGIAVLVLHVIALWKIAEKLNKPGWLAILLVIPLFGSIWMYVLYGILAWGK